MTFICNVPPIHKQEDMLTGDSSIHEVDIPTLVGALTTQAGVIIGDERKVFSKITISVGCIMEVSPKQKDNFKHL